MKKRRLLIDFGGAISTKQATDEQGAIMFAITDKLIDEPDEYVPLLKALPGASEERREAALRELTRKPNCEVRCKKCEHDRPEDISICLFHCANGEMFVEPKGGDERE
jgi:hypothetical protein